MADEKARLVVELGTKASNDLDWLVEACEVNKTTVVNRALQVHKLIMESLIRGDTVLVGDQKLIVIP